MIAVDPAGGYDAAISPDGRYVLASSRRRGSTALRMYDRTSDTWSQVTDGRGDDTEPYIIGRRIRDALFSSLADALKGYTTEE